MRALPVLFIVLALVACGGSVASVGDSAPAAGAPSSSSGSGGGTCPENPTPYCPWGGCLDGPLATCSGGKWVCPPPPTGCSGQCTGKPIVDCKCGTPTCSYGAWQCPDHCAADAGADAARDADANATFPCGELLVCHAASQYCKVGVGGPAGAPSSYGCEPIPTACTNAVTCACIEPAVGGQLCSDAPGVTVTFEYP